MGVREESAARRGAVFRGVCRGGGEVRSDLGVKELDVRVCIRVTHRMCVYLHGSTGVRGKYISFVRA